VNKSINKARVNVRRSGAKGTQYGSGKTQWEVKKKRHNTGGQGGGRKGKGGLGGEKILSKRKKALKPQNRKKRTAFPLAGKQGRAKKNGD